MMVRNFAARPGVVARRSLQGLDKAEQRSQRRAQLMARVGDEIDAHAFEPARLRQVAQGQDQGRLEAIVAERRDADFEGAFDRHFFEPDHPFGAAAGPHPRDGIEHVGRPQAAGEKLIPPQARQQ